MSSRIQHHRRYLMCRPEHFAVNHEINAWMHLTEPPNPARALQQWQRLHDTYVGLGHQVDLIDPIPGLDDMVFTANGGLVIDGVALGARFSVSERQPEERPFREWFAAQGFTVVEPEATQEGEGDLLLAGETILAGYGFRSQLNSHAEIAQTFDREVLPLRLINPAYYHLDTAICVLDPVPGPDGVTNIAYRPSAFDEPSQARLAKLFPDAIRMPTANPENLHLNAVSDGYNVVLPPSATSFAALLRERGYHPIPVDLSELQLGGGGIKCCTLELRGGRS